MPLVGRPRTLASGWWLSPHIAEMLGRRLPEVEGMLHDASDDLLAFTSYPVSHQKLTCSTHH